MSDTMLHSILQMPPELWTNDAIDIAQRHGRYLEASKRIIELERERDEARRDLVAAEELHRRRFGTLKAECEAVRDRLADSERDRDDAWKGWTDAINGWNKDIEKLEGAISELDEARRERDEARRERDEAISKLKFAQNELFTILRFQEDEKREHRNLLERLSFFQNRFESMRAERDQAMSDLEELREEQKEEA